MAKIEEELYQAIILQSRFIEELKNEFVNFKEYRRETFNELKQAVFWQSKGLEEFKKEMQLAMAKLKENYAPLEHRLIVLETKSSLTWGIVGGVGGAILIAIIKWVFKI